MTYKQIDPDMVALINRYSLEGDRIIKPPAERLDTKIIYMAYYKGDAA